jgi:hypothetical protein
MVRDYSMKDAHAAFIDILTQKYEQALKDEADARILLLDAQHRKFIYSSGLKEEGAKVPSKSSSNGHDPNTTIWLFDEQLAPPDEDPVTPISATHALYLLMRKHRNAGFSVPELVQLAKEEKDDYADLTEKVIVNIFWKQVSKKRMKRLADGKIVLTEAGMKFDRFRIPKGVLS